MPDVASQDILLHTLHTNGTCIQHTSTFLLCIVVHFGHKPDCRIQVHSSKRRKSTCIVDMCRPSPVDNVLPMTLGTVHALAF